MASKVAKAQTNGNMLMPALMMFGVLGCCCLAAGVGATLRTKSHKRSSRVVFEAQGELLVQDSDPEQGVE